MAGLSDLFGVGGTIEQLLLWNVIGQVLGALDGPFLTALQQDMNARNPLVVNSPADLAQAVVRNYMTQGAAAGEAAKSGIDAARFADLVHLAADAPAPGDLAVALRRGIIPETGTGPDATSFDQGIREGRLGDKWIAMMKELSVQWPTPADALDALLEGQISDAEARTLYHKFGGDPQFFQMLFDTRGSAPTPLEAIEMANRGIIPWSGTGPGATSYEQAFLEGPWRNKWANAYRQLGTYVPPERTVSALLGNGAITDAQAASYWRQSGMDDATIQAFLTDAHITQLSDYKGLTVATVLDMYFTQLVSQSDATTILEALKVSPHAAQLLLAYVDMRRAITAVNSAVSRISSLYAARKITKQAALESLINLQVPASSANDIIGTWDVVNSVNVKLLTEAQIVDAVFLGIMSPDEGMTELENIGYTPYDAWVLLSIKAKAALPNKPATGPAPPQGTPVPGVT